MPPPRTVVVQLPDYGSLRRLHAVAGAAVRTGSSFWRGLSGVDVVWVFGPHPFELMIILLARLKGRRVVFGVRQDTPEYFRARLPSPRWKPVLAACAGFLVDEELARSEAVERVFAACRERAPRPRPDWVGEAHAAQG